MTQHYSHVSLTEKRCALEKMFTHTGMASAEPSAAKSGDPVGDRVAEAKAVVSTSQPN